MSRVSDSPRPAAPVASLARLVSCLVHERWIHFARHKVSHGFTRIVAICHHVGPPESHYAQVHGCSQGTITLCMYQWTIAHILSRGGSPIEEWVRTSCTHHPEPGSSPFQLSLIPQHNMPPFHFFSEVLDNSVKRRRYSNSD